MRRHRSFAIADIRILTGNNDKGWTVVFHFDVPTGNNAVGVPWRDALVNSGLGGTTVLRDGDGTEDTISAAEKADIQSGAVFELVETVRAESGGTSNAQLRATARAAYARFEPRETQRIGSVLRYWGHQESRA